MLAAGLLEGGLVALLVSQFGVADGVGEVAFQALDGLDAGGQLGALAGDRLGGGRVVPQGRVLDPGVQLMQFSKRRFPVKDAS